MTRPTAPGVERDDLHLGHAHTLTVFTVRGARPGPTLATIGGIHGDEYEGPLTLSGLLRDIRPEELAGTWIVAPVANPVATAAGTRATPTDGLNLARCFPGDPDGSVTMRMAALIHQKVIAPADCVLDLHSGGTALDSAFFAGFVDAPGDIGARARAMAEAFGAPVVWRHAAPTAPGRTMSSAQDLGIPGVYVEATGGTAPDAETLGAYRCGVVRVLRHLGMLGDTATVADEAGPWAGTEPALQVEGSGDIDSSGPAPVSGLCTCHIRPLQRLAPDTVCFTITDLAGCVLQEARNAQPGIAIFCRRSRWVEQGETLFALARPSEGGSR